MGSDARDPMRVEGYTPASDERVAARYDHVGPNYFSTVGIPVILGREILERDSGRQPRVGLINQTLAKRYFSDANPLGKRIWNIHPDNTADFEIIGVVADAKYNGLRETTQPRY